jgi:hypothetical protein
MPAETPSRVALYGSPSIDRGGPPDFVFLQLASDPVDLL